jgi:hypothetical protein
VPVIVCLYSDRTEYRLTYIEAGVEEPLWGGRERDAWGAALALRGIRVDKDADYSPVLRLPRVHPAEVERQKRAAEAWLAWSAPQGGRGRQIYQDRDIVTGQVVGLTDGVSSWR